MLQPCYMCGLNAGMCFCVAICPVLEEGMAAGPHGCSEAERKDKDEAGREEGLSKGQAAELHHDLGRGEA